MVCVIIIQAVEKGDVKMVADIIAIVISFIALVFSLIQFFIEKDRNRKEATIHAFDSLEENENILFLFSLSKNEIDDLVSRKKNCSIGTKFATKYSPCNQIFHSTIFTKRH